MTIFLRLLADKDKDSVLSASCASLRSGFPDARVFEVPPESFRALPGAPFAYWASDQIRSIFSENPPFQSNGRDVRQGLATANDFRFLRTWWEHLPQPQAETRRWYGFTKGGSRAPFYSDIRLSINWQLDGKELKAWADPLYGNSGWSRILKSTSFYFRPGLTWPLRGIFFSAQAVPRDSIFSVAGKMAFAPPNEMGFWLAVFNSRAFDYLIGLFAGKVGGVQYEAGLIGGIPAPAADATQFQDLSVKARRAWSLRRSLDTVNEISHAFLLPVVLHARLSAYDASAMEIELAEIAADIDEIVFDLYGFNDVDRIAALARSAAASEASIENEQQEEDEEIENEADVDQIDGLLSWAVGVAFGRFDWRLATGERAAPPEPNPFDPLPTKSPGMLPDEAEPFHAPTVILVDDAGHPHDLVHVIEEVLARVDAPLPADLRRWLRRDFFPLHLKQYSKSRRKAPIYWPLSAASGTYTLWLYYPGLTIQTLYTAVNDFVEPKLKQVEQDAVALRNKGSARNRDDDKKLEALQVLESELVELRELLLQIAPTYRPDHDDGVQITAAPLWPVSRHKPWQKLLKDTWTKLEKGEYDWAHLAMAYWPERVREKCKTDKSLAIAHDLETLYVEPALKPTKARGKKGAGA